MSISMSQSPPIPSFMRRRASRPVYISIVFLIILLLAYQSYDLDRVRPRRTPRLLDAIDNSTFGFEKIFVVGLPSRTDRRDGMLLQASLTNMDIEFIDGVRGQDVSDKALVTLPDAKRLPDPMIGSWRGHMNAIQEIVKRNLSSAIIMEDDIDWDVRIRQQLKDFALSAQALTQPLQAVPDLYADPTYPQPPEGAPGTVPDMSFSNLPLTEPPRWSPYGDHWDLLWIGHCGMHFPFADNPHIPKGRVIHANDATVPQRRNLWTINIPFTLKEKYPEHTRAAHHVQEGVCSLGYAITQRTARQVLNEIALREVGDAFDILLRFFCEGVRGRRYHNCLTLQPALFHHHRPIGSNKAMSDIGDHGDEFRDKASTDMVRWSVRLNADVLMEGGTEFVDGYPDVDE